MLIWGNISICSEQPEYVETYNYNRLNTSKMSCYLAILDSLLFILYIMIKNATIKIGDVFVKL